MNISSAKTEAAVAYKGRQEALDKHIRIAAVAHALLGKVIDGPTGDTVLGALYGLSLSRIKPTHRVPDSAKVVRLSGEQSVALSLIAVQSDFEWACRNLVTDALEFWGHRWTPNLGEIKPPPPLAAPLGKRGWAGVVSEALRPKSADEGFINGCYSLLGMKATKQDMVFAPLFDFFRRCRNRIVHQDGTAGADLEEFARTKELQQSYEALSASARKMAPALPQVVSSQQIDLRPEHAVLFIIVTRALFDSLASRIRTQLDEDGYLRMVAHYGYFVDQHPFRTKVDKNVEQQARRFLRLRYHVLAAPKERLIADFKRLGIWDALVDRYHELREASR